MPSGDLHCGVFPKDSRNELHAPHMFIGEAFNLLTTIKRLRVNARSVMPSVQWLHAVCPDKMIMFGCIDDEEVDDICNAAARPGPNLLSTVGLHGIENQQVVNCDLYLLAAEELY